MNADTAFSGFGETEPKKLPGLTLIFCIQTWIGALGTALLAIYEIYVMLTQVRWMQEYLTMAPMTLVTIVMCILYARALASIHARAPETPGRCRTLMMISIVLTALCIALSTVLELAYGFISHTTHLPLGYVLRYLLVSLIVCEAWRRYFGVSEKVRETFAWKPEENPGYAGRPAEIGLFQTICWMSLVWYGGEGIEFFISLLTADKAGYLFASFPFFSILAVVRTIAALALPIIALRASHAGSGRRLTIFWCLGLTLALAILTTLTAQATWEIRARTAIMLPLMGSFVMFSGKTVLTLAFWWYFAVSDKARAWLEQREETGVV